MFSKRMILWLVLAVFVAALGLASCHKKDDGDEPDDTAETKSGPVYKLTGNEGSISGVIDFTGAPPAPRAIQMDSDPICAQKGSGSKSEEVVVKDGKLQNVFVYVKSGLPNNSFEPSGPEPALDQSGCSYHPHVVGMHNKQKIKIVNSDQTTHNVHPLPKENREWNESQPSGVPPLIKEFTKKEILIPVKCNIHSWMKAYIGVLDHPFFAVSAADGSFKIAGLPPGEYEIEAWHEKLGTKTMKVKVEAKGDTTAKFTYDAATAYHPPSLKMMPALVLP
jgi:hypothetical protein